MKHATKMMVHKRRSVKKSPTKRCVANVKDPRSGRERKCKNCAEPGSRLCATHERYLHDPSFYHGGLLSSRR